MTNIRNLGVNGPKVASIGLGCMSFAGFYGPTTEKESHRVLDLAVDNNINHLDTANVYGNGVSEEVIGAWLKKKRQNVVIATKGGIWRDSNGKRGFNNTKEHLVEQLDQSLRRLGVDYVDLYYVHRRQQDIPIEDVMETLLSFKQAGKIGGIGFSEISPSSLRRAAAVGPVMAVQSEYSLWSRQPELGMIQACEEVGSTFVPFSPLARGMFSQVAPDRSKFGDVDLRKTSPRFLDPNFEINLTFFDAFRDLAADLNMPSAGLAIAWVLDLGEHLVPIPGTRSVEHLEEIVTAFHFEMTPDVRDKIDKIMPRGFAHGDRYSDMQIIGIERYC